MKPNAARARDPLQQGLYRQPFDLYGGSFRLLELPEREGALTNVILRDKQVEIRGLHQQLDASEERSSPECRVQPFVRDVGRDVDVDGQHGREREGDPLRAAVGWGAKYC